MASRPARRCTNSLEVCTPEPYSHLSGLAFNRHHDCLIPPDFSRLFRRTCLADHERRPLHHSGLRKAFADLWGLRRPEQLIGILSAPRPCPVSDGAWQLFLHRL